ncbi:MAG: tyrosine-type recombinase/integrase [Armatimonadetes bacterium]|nr:tyrosine-type recombinase/integrase [Armatimonadota bacterium]
MRSTWNGFQSPLAEGIQHFLAYKRALGSSFLTEEYALRLLDAFLVKQKVQTIEGVTAECIDAFLASRPRKRSRSYNHLISVLGRLFTWLIKQSYLTYFPLRMQTRRETSQRIPFLFTPDMARRLLACAENLTDTRIAPLRGPTYRTIFALLYGLGLRVGEVTRLCLKDLDFERSLLVIRQTKFAKSRLVPFGPRMQELLGEYLQLRAKKHGPPLADEHLFSFGGGRPINRGTIGKTFRSLISQLELRVPEGTSPPRLHDLRHSFAVGTLLRWYRAGIDPETRLLHLSTFLGHVSPNSTAVYLTITPDLLLEANRRFERYAASAIKEVSP